MTASDGGPPPPLPPPPPGPPPDAGDGLPPFPVGPQRLHPASPVLDLVLSARQWAFPLAILILSSGASVLLAPAALLILALIVGWKVLAWSRFRYGLVGDVLVIEQGVLQRSRREVPLARIQQVDLRRKLRHRALGVAVVRVDTAGGSSGAEAVLEAIDDASAERLRAALLRRRAATLDPAAAGAPTAAPGAAGEGSVGEGALAAPGPASSAPTAGTAAEPVELVALRPAQLVVAGLTGSRLLAALPLAAAGVGLLFELPTATTEGILSSLPTGTVAIVTGAVIAVPVLLIAAVASSLLTDFGFTLARSGSDLHLRRGLLDQREATLSLHRVQVVRVHQNLVRRRLGLHAVQLQSAGSGHESEGEVSRLTIPYVTDAQLPELLDRVLPTDVAHPRLVPAPPAARRRSWLRVVGPATIALVVAAVGIGVATGSRLGALVLLAVLVAVADAELRYRNLGHVGTPSLVVARSGGFVRETAFVPVAKAQSTALTSSPFQRRAGLATLEIHVAGRGPVPMVHDGDAERLARLRRGALHAVDARRDEAEVRRRTRAEAAQADPGPPLAAATAAGPAATPPGTV